MSAIDYIGFVTIWIFARIRQIKKILFKTNSFVTIWIFARIRLGSTEPIREEMFCYHMDFC